MAATVIWNGLIGVDSFFVIGGCLLSYHTLKELDKTKGGNMMMWIKFYVHRYIRYDVTRSISLVCICSGIRIVLTGFKGDLVIDKGQEKCTQANICINFANNIVSTLFSG